MIGIQTLLAHVRDRFSARRKELNRLRDLPRFEHTSTTLIPPQFELVDAASFLAMYEAIVEQRIYEFKPVTDRPRILDCGANVGVSVVWFRQQFPDSHVLAFEPDPNVFQTLEANIESVCTLKNVELINAAVWHDDSATLDFHAEGADAGRAADAGSTAALTVPAVRLRKFLLEPVDLLKIDVEGAELDVLQDCRDRLHQVHNLFVEYHSFASQPQRLDELLLLLRECGFRYWIDSEVERPRPLVNRIVYLGMDLQLNIYAVRDLNSADRSVPASPERH